MSIVYTVLKSAKPRATRTLTRNKADAVPDIGRYMNVCTKFFQGNSEAFPTQSSPTGRTCVITVPVFLVVCVQFLCVSKNKGGKDNGYK